jgi:hypothetical protein
VGIEDGGVEGLVPQVGADLAQRDALLQEVGRVAVAQRLLTLLTGFLHRRSTTATIRFRAPKLKWCVPFAEVERRFWSSKFPRDIRSPFRAGCSMRCTAAGCRKKRDRAWRWRHCWS